MLDIKANVTIMGMNKELCIILITINLMIDVRHIKIKRKIIMKKIILLVGIFTIILLSGCSTKTVVPVSSEYQLNHVCIEDNLKVKVGGFLGVVTDIFNEHGISTEKYEINDKPTYCEVKMTYTATQKWDMAIYLNHAELRLYKNNQKIGYAEYHLTGGGGLDLSKWASVKSKMTPIVEELLAQYEKKDVPIRKNNFKKQTTVQKMTIEVKLKKIKKMHNGGLITDHEYTTKRKQLLNNY